jgi:hypothetical protein
MEAEIGDHYVQRWLDHSNLSTTSRYLKTTRKGMRQALRFLEEHRACKFVAKNDSGQVASAETPQHIPPAKSM